MNNQTNCGYFFYNFLIFLTLANSVGNVAAKTFNEEEVVIMPKEGEELPVVELPKPIFMNRKLIRSHGDFDYNEDRFDENIDDDINDDTGDDINDNIDDDINDRFDGNINDNFNHAFNGAIEDKDHEEVEPRADKIIDGITPHDGIKNDHRNETNSVNLEHRNIRNSRLPRRTPLDIAVEASAREGLNAVIEFYAKIEPNILRNGQLLAPDHPAALLSKFSAPQDETEDREMAAYATIAATKAFKKNYKQFNILARQAQSPKVSLRRTALEGLCPPRDPPVCVPASERYRTHDGTCNNKRRPRWGAAQMPFNRFLLPQYGDGVDTTRSSVDGGPLASSRFVSLLVHGAQDGDAPITLMTAQWGQLLDHDMTSTAQPRSINGSVPRCCGGKDFHPSCFPIKVPHDDPWLGPLKVRCLEFLRSAPAQRRDCVLSWREQTNQATSYIDASPIYSNSAKSSDNSRMFRNGLLIFGRSNLADDVCKRGGLATQCIRSGDGRSSEQPGLLALHHVWVGEHNHIATELSELNLHWSDEKIYQETRRIIGAMFQHITYREFLPIIVGREVCKLFELDLQTSGYFEGYNSKTNPGIANSFSAAAFRFGHSLIQDSYMRCDRHHNMISTNVSLHEEFQRGDIGSAGSLHRLLRGMASQRALKRDEFISPELTNHLFQTPGFPFGLDLAAINIQRGRDHGIPPYTAWRIPCGLSAVNSWEDFSRVVGPESAKRISHAYSSVHDVDLFVGGISERPVVGGLVGPTFACIIAQQFSNSRKGDRFWYENGGFESSFTPAQLQSIRQVSLAQVLCRAVGGGTFQPHIFIPHDFPGNQRLPCGVGSLAPIDLSPWLEQDPFDEPTGFQTLTPERVFDIVSSVNSLPSPVQFQHLKANQTGADNGIKDDLIIRQNSHSTDFIPNAPTGIRQPTQVTSQINDKLDFKRKSVSTKRPTHRPVPGINNKLSKRPKITLNIKSIHNGHRRPQTTTKRTVIVNNVPFELRRSSSVDAMRSETSIDVTAKTKKDSDVTEETDTARVHQNIFNEKGQKDFDDKLLRKERKTTETGLPVTKSWTDAETKILHETINTDKRRKSETEKRATVKHSPEAKRSSISLLKVLFQGNGPNSSEWKNYQTYQQGRDYNLSKISDLKEQLVPGMSPEWRINTIQYQTLDGGNKHDSRTEMISTFREPAHHYIDDNEYDYLRKNLEVDEKQNSDERYLEEEKRKEPNERTFPSQQDRGEHFSKPRDRKEPLLRHSNSAFKENAKQYLNLKTRNEQLLQTRAEDEEDSTETIDNLKKSNDIDPLKHSISGEHRRVPRDNDHITSKNAHKQTFLFSNLQTVTNDTFKNKNKMTSTTKRSRNRRKPRPTSHCLDLRQYQNVRPIYTRPQKVIVGGPHSDQYEIEINIRQTNKTAVLKPISSNTHDRTSYPIYGYDRYTKYMSSTRPYAYFQEDATTTVPDIFLQNQRTKPPTIIYLNEDYIPTTTKKSTILQNFLSFASSGFDGIHQLVNPNRVHKEKDRPQYVANNGITSTLINSPHSSIPSSQNVPQLSSFSQVNGYPNNGPAVATSSAISSGNFGSIMGLASANGADSTFSFNIRPKPIAEYPPQPIHGHNYELESPLRPAHSQTLRPQYANERPNNQFYVPSHSPFSTANKRPSQQFHSRTETELVQKPIAINREPTDHKIDYDYAYLSKNLEADKKEIGHRKEMEPEDDQENTDVFYEDLDGTGTDATGKRFDKDSDLAPEQILMNAKELTERADINDSTTITPDYDSELVDSEHQGQTQRSTETTLNQFNVSKREISKKLKNYLLHNKSENTNDITFWNQQHHDYNLSATPELLMPLAPSMPLEPRTNTFQHQDQDKRNDYNSSTELTLTSRESSGPKSDDYDYDYFRKKLNSDKNEVSDNEKIEIKDGIEKIDDYSYEDYSTGTDGAGKRFDRDGYLRPEHMLQSLINSNASTTLLKSNDNTTITPDDDNSGLAGINNSELIITRLPLPTEVIKETPNRVVTTGNVSDTIGKSIQNEILAEDYTEDDFVFTSQEEMAMTSSKKIASNETLTPITILTKPERPDNWVFYDTPMNISLLPELPQIRMDTSSQTAQEVPIPFSELNNLWINNYRRNLIKARDFATNSSKQTEEFTKASNNKTGALILMDNKNKTYTTATKTKHTDGNVERIN